MVVAGRDSWRRNRHPSVLRFLIAQSFAADLQKGQARGIVRFAFRDADIDGRLAFHPRVVHVIVEANRNVLVSGVVIDAFFGGIKERGSCVNLQRFPGAQPFFDLFRKAIGITGGNKGILRHLSRYLVVAVSVRGSADEDGCHHQRPSHTNNAHHIRQSSIVAPLIESFLTGFREAVIDRASPVLIDSVVAAGCQQLLRSHQAESVVSIDRHGILSALAPRQRQQHAACA